jgi:hypothetical protein
MSNITFQSTNILNDFYTDGIYSYILTSTFITQQVYFNDICNYCKTYIPSWIPILKHAKNRLIFNSGTMFEIAFHKNLIILIPLYITNYSVYEDNILKIIQWCKKYVAAETTNEKLLNLIDYKLIIYTPVNNHTNLKTNILKTNKTILGTDLYFSMYESLPIPINNNNQNTQNTQNTQNAPQLIAPGMYTPYQSFQSYESFQSKQSNPTKMQII